MAESAYAITMPASRVRGDQSHWLLMGPAVACVVAFIVLPVLVMALHSFWTRTATGAVVPILTLANWKEFFGDPFYGEVLLSTGKLACVTTLICVIIGYPVAYTLTLLPQRFRMLLLVLLFLPSWISYVVRTMSWLHVLGQNGLINMTLERLGLISAPLPLLYNEFAVYVGMVHYTLTYMILNIFIGLQGVDRKLVDAARTLGAGEGWAFLEVTLPLSLPGLSAGCLLCFILSAGTYITPMLLGGTGNVYYAGMIYDSVITQLDWPFGATLAVTFIVALCLLVSIYARLAGLSHVFKRVSA